MCNVSLYVCDVTVGQIWRTAQIWIKSSQWVSRWWLVFGWVVWLRQSSHHLHKSISVRHLVAEPREIFANTHGNITQIWKYIEQLFQHTDHLLMLDIVVGFKLKVKLLCWLLRGYMLCSPRESIPGDPLNPPNSPQSPPARDPQGALWDHPNL